MTVKYASAVLLAFLTLAACDDGPSEPVLDRSEVAGTYALTAFTFDPQGSLPAVDVAATFGASVPAQMFVFDDGRLQFVAQEAGGGLITADGAYNTTASGIRITFAENTRFRDLLLSRVMAFDYAAGTLTFSGPAPEGVPRARLVALFPQLADEQLLDPVPGSLQITLTRG